MTNEFCTVSSPSRKQRQILLIWLVMALASLGAITVTLAFCVMLEVVLALVFLVMLRISSRAYWELRFEGAQLFLTDCGSRQTYRVFDVPASDFDIRQTEAQKAKNLCDLKIKNTMFNVYDAREADKLVRYIEEHFQG